MKIDLTGKAAVVTGATRGIGRAIAASLAAAGARVAVVGRNAETAQSAAAELGHGAQGFAADVANPESAIAMIAAVESAFGAIDILVNNAGITRDNIMPRLKDADWDEVINANLRGAFLTTRAAVRGMMKRRWGRVINISSVVGLVGNKGQSNYAASKAGLIGLTKFSGKRVRRAERAGERRRARIHRDGHDPGDDPGCASDAHAPNSIGALGHAG